MYSSGMKCEKSKILRLFAIASCFGALAFLSCSCEWYDYIWEPTIRGEMDRNKANLAKLRVGMSKEEVKAVMGEPLKEKFCTDRVWYYYSEPRWQDGAATHDECTPLVFDEDGFLAGWGVKYYKDNYEFNMWPGANEKFKLKK